MCTNVSSGDAGKVLPESVRHVLTGQHQTQDSVPSGAASVRCRAAGMRSPTLGSTASGRKILSDGSGATEDLLPVF